MQKFCHLNRANVTAPTAYTDRESCMFVEKRAIRPKAATGSIRGYKSLDTDTSVVKSLHVQQ